MAGGFVICEYATVKEEFKEFGEVMGNLRKELIIKGLNDWGPLKFAGISDSNQIQAMDYNSIPSGMAPKSGEFGESTIIPALFANIASTRLVTWNQWLTLTGSRIIMRGAGTGGLIAEDYKVGICGLAFLDKAIRISEFKMQISDRKIGRINIEEAFAYECPAVIFEEGYILDEETGFDLTAFVLSLGPQRIKPIGLQINRVPNKMQISLSGAALT